MYDPPSLSSTFKYPNKTIQSENNNTQQTSSRYYDPFNYSFYPQSNTNIQTNNNQNLFQSNNNPNLLTHHSFPQPLPTNSTQTNFFSQNQRKPYFNSVKSSQRRFQNPSLSHISTDPLYQMNQHTTYNPTQISPTVNMAQSVAPPPQYIPIQQDTFINTSASISEPMKHRSTTISTEYPAFQITFPQQETSSTQTYRRTINPTSGSKINLCHR